MKLSERLLDWYPVMAAVLFELATGGHIIRMFVEQSAVGQEPISWLMVSLGLYGWYKWYKIRVPDQKPAIYTALASSIINLFAFFVCIYFKYLV